MTILMPFLQTATAAVAPVSLGTVILGINTLTCLAIVWGGGRLLGKIETQISENEKKTAETFARLWALFDGLEERTGRLEGRH